MMKAAIGTAPVGTLSIDREFVAREPLNVELTDDGDSSVSFTVAAAASEPAGAVTVSVSAPSVALAEPPLAAIGALEVTLLGVAVDEVCGVAVPPPHPPSNGATPRRSVPKRIRYRKRPRLTKS
jgi:hypothetical protein